MTNSFMNVKWIFWENCVSSDKHGMQEIKNIKTYVTVKDNSPQDQVLNKLTQNYTVIEIPTPSSVLKTEVLCW